MSNTPAGGRPQPAELILNAISEREKAEQEELRWQAWELRWHQLSADIRKAFADLSACTPADSVEEIARRFEATAVAIKARDSARRTEAPHPAESFGYAARVMYLGDDAPLVPDAARLLGRLIALPVESQSVQLRADIDAILTRRPHLLTEVLSWCGVVVWRIAPFSSGGWTKIDMPEATRHEVEAVEAALRGEWPRQILEQHAREQWQEHERKQQQEAQPPAPPVEVGQLVDARPTTEGKGKPENHQNNPAADGPLAPDEFRFAPGIVAGGFNPRDLVLLKLLKAAGKIGVPIGTLRDAATAKKKPNPITIKALEQHLRRLQGRISKGLSDHDGAIFLIDPVGGNRRLTQIVNGEETWPN